MILDKELYKFVRYVIIVFDVVYVIQNSDLFLYFCQFEDFIMILLEPLDKSKILAVNRSITIFETGLSLKIKWESWRISRGFY
jgi:hypothetical protein